MALSITNSTNRYNILKIDPRYLLGPFILFIVFAYLWTVSLSSIINDSIVNYFYPAWSIEFKTMTDLETLANLLYVGFPTALILISVALWVVMIGIIKVTMSEKSDL